MTRIFLIILRIIMIATFYIQYNCRFLFFERRNIKEEVLNE